ncbi:hypothetical protein [Salipiger abyssi]|uniref:Uncharacterized protein n=1 Tax=Salipiger abyssi TaxID=1250539 RepID=A0A1P8UXN8_9RHOB|nr:hypothetical protein [Salipiger abyssi]ALF02130.1 hypothetical protein vBPeaSP1_039 [Pelagibaca phage vB_PeaS-P1]APZ54145.1 hypothetical protein Ga0080574_TMP3811 [Salipiger abyssi]
MTRPSLTEQIDRIDFSDAAKRQFLELVNASSTDERGAVVLVAAAALLAQEHPIGTRTEDAALARLGAEFIQLVFTVRDMRQRQSGHPVLQVVGGTDA